MQRKRQGEDFMNFKVGDPVMGSIKGTGKVHQITKDKDYPLIVRFDEPSHYRSLNHYYSLEGKGLTSDFGTITKL